MCWFQIGNISTPKCIPNLVNFAFNFTCNHADNSQISLNILCCLYDRNTKGIDKDTTELNVTLTLIIFWNLYLTENSILKYFIGLCANVAIALRSSSICVLNSFLRSSKSIFLAYFTISIHLCVNQITTIYFENLLQMSLELLKACGY